MVATTAGGLAELVTDQTGYPAQPANPASRADALTDQGARLHLGTS